ncbi:MAG: DUF4258 domain-containing protein [Chloroflexi bacterium]|uniref:DUF4258 domain-containing protein n=1 Tax=Candidatus Chlorohelix allophototropha TaxID=3003348 RepID=A0A8T7M5B9_9CHLR|nr:DUF4258 domain-containing protein [Chloroflexota bacterium]WJW69203.1 DUF4258 domain-containing protein [Chloroflexota bacterium L227-S17]
MEAGLTYHATRRMRQRNFNQQEIYYILNHGRIERKTGICFYFLGERDIPREDRNLDWVQKLIGVTVLLSANQQSIITIYKNPKALRTIKKKLKHRILPADKAA